MSWNVQGKGFDDLKNSWPVLGMEGFGIQELGGFSALSSPWKIEDVELDGGWVFYVTSPPLAHRGIAVGIPSRLACSVDHVRHLSCGICVTLKFGGCKKFLISAHLPHRQRNACIETWQTVEAELEQALKNRRLHDNVVTMTDTNYELGLPQEMLNPDSTDERGLIAGTIMQSNGLVATKPQTYKWSNQRGSTSKIDFILVGSTGNTLSSQGVFEDSDFQLGCDHRAVCASFDVWDSPQRSRNKRSRKTNKCGKWRVNSAKLLEQAAEKAEFLDLHCQDLDVGLHESLSSSCSLRPKSLRTGPDFIRDKIKERRLLGGSAARALGKEISAMRKQATATWLTSVLDKAAKGDFFAISYFKRRNSVINAHSNYIVRAGGKHRATAELRRYFSLKYTPTDLPPPDLPHKILSCGIPLPQSSLITTKEIADVINTCKLGKSCGNDGISFEFLTALADSDLAQHFADFLNSILFGTSPLPDSWLLSHLTFIPKIDLPSQPKHLRPIVLSSTPGKVFQNSSFSSSTSLPPACRKSTRLHSRMPNTRWLHLSSAPCSTQSRVSSPPHCNQARRCFCFRPSVSLGHRQVPLSLWPKARITCPSKDYCAL